MMFKVMEIIKKKKLIDIIAYLFIIIFLGIFIILSLGRHLSLKSFQNDLGTYSQVTWNNLQGNFFESSGSMVAHTLKPDGSTDEYYKFLAGHFSPIILFFVPLYVLWADPRVFLIIQVIAVGIGALPIYWLAKEKISNFGGLIFLISYLLHPIIHNALLYDFHEVTFAVPLVTFALWFWSKNRTGWLLFFLGLLILVQEQVSLIVFMFGLYLAFIDKRRKLGLTIAAISLIYFFLIILILMPEFSSTGISPLLQKGLFTTRYGWLGESFGEITKTIIERPLWVLQNTLGLRQLNFLITLLLPVMGLAIYSSLFILTLPILFINFLSNFTMTYSIYFYHSAIIVGIIYFAAIFSFDKIIKSKKIQRFFLILILITTLAVSYVYSVTPLSARYSWQDYQPSANASLLKEVKLLIPKDASISVQHNLGPHFSLRRKLFHFPYNFAKAEYVILDIFNPYQANPRSIFGFENVCEIDCQWFLMAASQMFERQEFGVIYSKDGWLVFKRNVSQQLNQEAKKDFEQALERLYK